MWSYIFFFIHLNGTKINDYTALEMFVYKLVSLEVAVVSNDYTGLQMYVYKLVSL
ncbi:hypothetical protein DPMN_126311 [Dreissena polymorpha]|uniref:Uncharacterized protein n=1 Tax=Dreissena polymorpha TaxID=45954 RepID=A0A9D4GZA3_DREPO|nr:hypothetical protein DPMN_126311 [Dreissena polymorpha]